MNADRVAKRCEEVKEKTPLARRESQVFVFMYEVGATESQVAKSLDVAVGTVRSHKDRVDRKIRNARNLADAADEAGVGE